MRIPLLSMFMTSPFEGLQEHAEVIKDCSWAFQEAVECHISYKCSRFDSLRGDIIEMEREADAIKRRIRGHIPKGTLMPIDKFQLFRYLREQDSVLDAMEETLDWLSVRPHAAIPEALHKDIFYLVDTVLDPVDELSSMVAEARKYFKTYREEQRVIVKDIIRTLRLQEHEADHVEHTIKAKVFNMDVDPVTIFHIVRLAEIIGSIADHAENAGDMMRAMVAK
ncbi:MAG: TIGR00153 family protein [Deltaproteobacteria bacterium]|nr:TIGR00153 family protein [Deltaproteobacteria bacterium]